MENIILLTNAIAYTEPQIERAEVAIWIKKRFVKHVVNRFVALQNVKEKIYVSIAYRYFEKWCTLEDFDAS